MRGEPHHAGLVRELTLEERLFPQTDCCYSDVVRRTHATLEGPACLAVDVPIRSSHELRLRLRPAVLSKRPNPQVAAAHFPDQRRLREPPPIEPVSLIVSRREKHGLNFFRRPPRDSFPKP